MAQIPARQGPSGPTRRRSVEETGISRKLPTMIGWPVAAPPACRLAAVQTCQGHTSTSIRRVIAVRKNSGQDDVRERIVRLALNDPELIRNLPTTRNRNSIAVVRGLVANRWGRSGRLFMKGG